jgi:membrane-bound lytic murein transglycosylase B
VDQGAGGARRKLTVALLVALALAAPPPNAPIPREPDALARELTEHTGALHAGVDAWRGKGPIPPDVELEALYQQRIFIHLTAKPRLARAVVARLRGRIRREALETLAAREALVRLTPPTRRPLRSFRTGPAARASSLLAWYREAERRFGVGWHVLAAVNFVESAFGKLRSNSTAGAQGPMQFLPATWRAYGLGGDVRDPHDAILGAANYLHASGAPRDYPRALYAYNRSPLYVGAVLRYANQMKRDVRAFFGYYAWQVWVRTPSGPRRLTGPGL